MPITGPAYRTCRPKASGERFFSDKQTQMLDIAQCIDTVARQLFGDRQREVRRRRSNFGLVILKVAFERKNMLRHIFSFGSGATDVELTKDDLCEIESAASKITIQGARYPEQLEKMTGL